MHTITMFETVHHLYVSFFGTVLTISLRLVFT